MAAITPIKIVKDPNFPEPATIELAPSRKSESGKSTKNAAEKHV
jgi:hypothetical protein